MAKGGNDLDIKKVITFAEKNQDELLTNIPKETMEALKHFENNPKAKVYIFAKSIAYKSGGSKIRGITGFSEGFKGSFKQSNKEILQSSSYKGNSKFNKVVRFALIVCLKDKTRISTEEDKTERAETEEVFRTKETLNKLMEKTSADYLTIMMGNEEYKIDGFRQISGRPKADMAFTYKNKDVIFVSHKLGKQAGSFQQYGGFSNDLGMTNNTRVSPKIDSKGNREIKEFVGNIDTILFKKYGLIPDSNGMYDLKETPRGTNFAVPVKSRKIAELAMFGKDYGKPCGLDNVHILIDGNIMFNKLSAGIYELDGSFHRTYNPKLSGVEDELSNLSSLGIYRPMLMIMRSASQGLKQGGFMNARAVIWPNNKITQGYFTKYKKELKESK